MTTASQRQTRVIPEDKICLRLILVTGKTNEFIFSPSDTAYFVAQHVFENWPQDWKAETVSSHNILKLIYQGRFLHGNVTLGALHLPLGKRTTMHLVARENLPEPASQGPRNREKTGERSCCCTVL
ncbi:ubiquitin-like protein 3 [Exaiptasia diaphana]|uniref:UBL3-like ubiquitin domain-containing protein n=1 Tax=Exaiptasia diaphana TaxID=2652724 RepID=A0A913XJ19_EXADI|nr:ubiquitin-like protein 3 [Exaiptasia diaphana]